MTLLSDGSPGDPQHPEQVPLRTRLGGVAGGSACLAVILALGVLVPPLQRMSGLSWAGAAVTWVAVTLFVSAIELEKWRALRGPRVRRRRRSRLS